MTKAEIISLLDSLHKEFINQQMALEEKQFSRSFNGKWSPGQELDHIIRSVKPIVLAFRLPKFLLKLLFGKSNRPSITYEELVEKYHGKLLDGGRASGRFIPKGIPFKNRRKATLELESIVHQLKKKIESQSEQTLDEFILPHPILGKLTLREMLYFTAYHVEHHRRNTLKNLEVISMRK